MSKWFNIGDRVLFMGNDGEGSYEYTVEEIDSDGHIWGSDLPQPYYGEWGTKNFHNPRPHFTRLVTTLNKKTISKHKMI